jgi:peroxiredoxin (alkyl hydroperoxide reductase subunit C)
MKKYIYIIVILITNYSYSQSNKDIRIPTLNETAPSFTAHSTMGDIKYPEDFFDKWRMILSHPADFTPVCTSEIWELAQLQEDFEKLNTKLMVISTDGLNSHLQWIESMESIEYKGKKPAKIKFPLISDVNMTISKLFGMQHPYVNSTLNVRGVFIISPNNHIQFIAFYPSNVGRNVEELKRVLIALQTTYKGDYLTPVNWTKGDDCMLSAPKTIEEANQLKSKNDPDYYSYAWYMWFKKSKK